MTIEAKSLRSTDAGPLTHVNITGGGMDRRVIARPSTAMDGSPATLVAVTAFFADGGDHAYFCEIAIKGTAGLPELKKALVAFENGMEGIDLRDVKAPVEPEPDLTPPAPTPKAPKVKKEKAAPAAEETPETPAKAPKGAAPKAPATAPKAPTAPAKGAPKAPTAPKAPAKAK